MGGANEREWSRGRGLMGGANEEAGGGPKIWGGGGEFGAPKIGILGQIWGFWVLGSLNLGFWGHFGVLGSLKLGFWGKFWVLGSLNLGFWGFWGFGVPKIGILGFWGFCSP